MFDTSSTNGSVHGPLFFNIYINDLLLSLVETGICNYPDGTTICTFDKTLDSVIAKLENDTCIVIQWFGDYTGKHEVCAPQICAKQSLLCTNASFHFTFPYL